VDVVVKLNIALKRNTINISINKFVEELAIRIIGGIIIGQRHKQLGKGK